MSSSDAPKAVYIGTRCDIAFLSRWLIGVRRIW
jgi:hypothetical protein